MEFLLEPKNIDLDIQEKIIQYRNNISDWEYVETVLRASDIETLFATIVHMLRSGNGLHIREANFFLRDVVLLAPKHINEEFRANFSQREIIEAMNDNVFANNFFTRSNTVYTIGKLGFTSSVPVLIKAFHQSMESDPLLLLSLFSELRWLQGKVDWELLNKPLHNSHFLIRWATLQILDHYSVYPEKTQEFLLKKSYLEILLTDTNEWVKQEANYLHRELLHLQNIQGLPRNQKRKLRRELDRSKPWVTFFHVVIRFENYLSTSNQVDYQLSELEEFVDKFVETIRPA